MRRSCTIIMRTKGATGPDAERPTNVVEKSVLKQGDIAKGFAEADVVIERTFDSKPMHQGYIELQSCIANCSDDGQVDLWCCTQAPWVYRDRLTAILDIDSSKINIQQSELGGGFGGKTTFYIEPLAVALSRKAKAAVKMTMTAPKCCRRTGPVSGTQSKIKIGCKEGRHHRRRAVGAGLPDRSVHRIGIRQCTAGDLDPLRHRECGNALL